MSLLETIQSLAEYEKRTANLQKVRVSQLKVTDVSSGKVSVFNDNLSSHFFTDCIVPERIAKLFVYSQPSNTTLSQFCQRAVISKKYFLEEKKKRKTREEKKAKKRRKRKIE